MIKVAFLVPCSYGLVSVLVVPFGPWGVFWVGLLGPLGTLWGAFGALEGSAGCWGVFFLLGLLFLKSCLGGSHVW